MEPQTFTITEPLRYAGDGREQTAFAQVRQPHRLRIGDVVRFPSSDSQLLVAQVQGERVLLIRQAKWRIRFFGGLAWRAWWRQELDDEGEVAQPIPRHRAQPLRRRRKVWPEISLGAGAVGVVIYQAYAEGSLV